MRFVGAMLGSTCLVQISDDEFTYACTHRKCHRPEPTTREEAAELMVLHNAYHRKMTERSP